MLLRAGSLGVARFAVTDRSGGASDSPYDGLNLGDHVGDDPDAVAENRHRLLRALPGADRLAFMDQVHGVGVAEAGVAEAGVAAPAGTPEAPRADALFCASEGVAVVVLSADCVPVLLAAREGSARPVVAVAHAGRLGVALGVVPAALAALARRGVGAAELVGYVGPAVCGRCYEVPAGMRDEVAAVAPEAYATSAAGTPALDLPAAVEAQLRSAGVAELTRAPECTAESAHLYSHRRDGVTGRFASVVWAPRPESVPGSP